MPDRDGVPSTDDARREPFGEPGGPHPDALSVRSAEAQSPAVVEQVAAPAPPPRRTAADRILSFAEVVLCSGFPTQLAVTVVLLSWGIKALTPDGKLSLRYVVYLSAADTALVLLLVISFLRLRGERPRDVFIGTRAPGPEVIRGVILLAPTFALLICAALIIQWLAPWLRNAGGNPFEDLLQTPVGIAVFAGVAILAGGVREEIQRAFVLHRFEQHLGGIWFGLVIFSLAFGSGHALQGWDAAIMTGLLGAFWGYVYIRRRSIVAPLVCHAMFNLVEVLFHGYQP